MMTCEEFEKFLMSATSGKWEEKEARIFMGHVVDCSTGRHSLEKYVPRIRELTGLAAAIAKRLLERQGIKTISQLRLGERRAYAQEIGRILNQWTTPTTPRC